MATDAHDNANDKPAPGAPGAAAQKPAGATPSTTEVLAASIAGAVERQLTQYVSAMSKQVEAARAAAEATRSELRTEFAHMIDVLNARVDNQQTANEAYQRALQAALEERLAEFANHQYLRLSELDNKVLAIPAQVQASMPTQVAAATHSLRELIDAQTAAMTSRIDDLQRTTRRFDEQATALVQHVNDTTNALATRMDEGDERVELLVEERLVEARNTVERISADSNRMLGEQTEIIGQRVDAIDMKTTERLVSVENRINEQTAEKMATLESYVNEIAADANRLVTEQSTLIGQRVDALDMKTTDRMLAMEERVNEQAGTKIAGLEATIGRIGAGFDDAMGALSQRLLELENAQLEIRDSMESLAAQVAKVDEEALEAVKEQLSSAVGEAMLVRIELDRLAQATDDKLEKTGVRMAEIEALLADQMDVSTAVQLERLDELERGMRELNPNQFVRKVEANGAPEANGTTANGTADSNNHNNSNSNDNDTDSEPSFSSH